MIIHLLFLQSQARWQLLQDRAQAGEDRAQGAELRQWHSSANLGGYPCTSSVYQSMFDIVKLADSDVSYQLLTSFSSKRKLDHILQVSLHMCSFKWRALHQWLNIDDAVPLHLCATPLRMPGWSGVHGQEQQAQAHELLDSLARKGLYKIIRRCHVAFLNLVLWLRGLLVI